METTGQQGNGAWVAVDTKNLKVEGENKGPVLVARTSGRVDGSNAKEFQDALESILGSNANALLLDMKDLSYISSAGLRVILLIARQLQGKSGKFGVCSLSPSISEVFQISGFDKIIPVHTAQADALASLGS